MFSDTLVEFGDSVELTVVFGAAVVKFCFAANTYAGAFGARKKPDMHGMVLRINPSANRNVPFGSSNIGGRRTRLDTGNISITGLLMNGGIRLPLGFLSVSTPNTKELLARDTTK